VPEDHNFLSSNNSKKKSDYFRVRVSPELTYFLNPKFALNIGLGGIVHEVFDGNTEDAMWAVNFNPVFWRFGIKVKL
jgi:hypothetical protein